MLEDTHLFLDAAAKHLDIPQSVLKKLKLADAEHVFQIELGSGKKFEAYRIQHNNQRGPYKGGIRFHPQVNPDEIRTLATLMSLKTAAVGLPLGGGKGGVRVNPRELSKAELEELSRRYVAELHPHIGPDKDVPAPDVNTNATIIDWMVDEYEKITGDSSKASFTGKSIKNGGSLGRDAATGRGGVLALEELLQIEKFQNKRLTFAVQGYGNVGSFFGVTARERHASWRMVAASDSEAAVYSGTGLDAKALQDYKAQGGRFKNFSENVDKTISNNELLALDVDVLVLAGLEDAVTPKNAGKIKAKYILEIANGPITKEAYDQLTAKHHVVLPDIIANAGGVIVSYLEWLQNKNGSHWSEAAVNDRLAEYMKAAVKNTYGYAARHKLGPKEAAFALALQKLSSTQVKFSSTPLAPCAYNRNIKEDAMYTLPALDYAYDALGKYISKDIMELHHDKHHQTYVDKLNGALEQVPELQAKSLEELLQGLDSVSEGVRTAVRNHGGGHFNHTAFWKFLSPEKDQTPSGKLGDELTAKYGSYQAFMDDFTKAALGVFGSGWAWLMPDLSIVTTPNQDNPIMNGQPAPILGLDVWEHAYYLDYTYKRADYVAAWWHVANWQEAARRYTGK